MCTELQIGKMQQSPDGCQQQTMQQSSCLDKGLPLQQTL